MQASNSQANGHGTSGLKNNTGNHTGESPVTPRSRRCLEWINTHLHVLPILTFVFLCVTLLISYIIAVANKHVEPNFPYISYTAIKPPERGVFSQLMNMESVIMALNICIKFAISREIIRKHESQVSKGSSINMAALVCGLLSTLGLSMVANFQTVVMRPGHYIGAGLAFGLGTAYCWLHSVLTWKLRQSNRYSHYRRLSVVQFIISCCLTVFLITFAITKAYYKIAKRQGVGTKWDKLRVPYLFSTVSEWLTVICMAAFSLTFYIEFKNFRFNFPSVQPKSDSRNEPQSDAQEEVHTFIQAVFSMDFTITEIELWRRFEKLSFPSSSPSSKR